MTYIDVAELEFVVFDEFETVVLVVVLTYVEVLIET